MLWKQCKVAGAQKKEKAISTLVNVYFMGWMIKNTALWLNRFY
jgi:hypothetical protein